MAVMNVNPTRMELTNLKRKLVTARRGHKLLKDKRDELMRRFLELVRENKALRLKVEAGIKQANAHMALARSVMSDEALSVALMMPAQKMELDVEEKNIMSVIVPQLALSDIMPDLLKLAEIEKTCQLLASEIEKTRRRVNALEHVMIPQYEDTIKYITMKLDEAERSSTTRLMKVKDMMLQEAHHYQ